MGAVLAQLISTAEMGTHRGMTGTLEGGMGASIHPGIVKATVDGVQVLEGGEQRDMICSTDFGG